MLLTVEKVILLGEVEFFSSLPGEVLAEISAHLEEVELAKDEVLVAKGDPGDSMFVVAAGLVGIEDEDREAKRLGRGSFFGELAALDPDQRPFTVRACAESLVLKLGSESLYELITGYPDVARNVIRFLCRNYRKTIGRT